ncbi:MAG TPA: cell division protein SepF [Negativicutes bacterium]|jgi:cell division inhibitor SepF
MAIGLIDKLTNFLMPVEDVEIQESVVNSRKTAHLRVHSHAVADLKMLIASPYTYDAVQLYAEHLKANVAIVVNFENVAEEQHQSINDFLTGVCYVIGGSVERITDSVLLYSPAQVDISKELYAYSVPTYVKQKNEL